MTVKTGAELTHEILELLKTQEPSFEALCEFYGANRLHPGFNFICGNLLHLVVRYNHVGWVDHAIEFNPTLAGGHLSKTPLEVAGEKRDLVIYGAILNACGRLGIPVDEKVRQRA